ncbi:MAG: DUF5320 family protein [Prolixibacteraceae bacterium]|jgi:hypothetical protein|nr:DUF5320 family protein [Prolixibacteraceae bacterium]
MSRLNHKGPENEGAKTGRKLGKCKKVQGEETDFQFGQGMGMKRRVGGGEGQAKRLHTYDERKEE